MKRTFSKFIVLVLLTACISWIHCGKDNSTDSTGNVKNTDFVAEESFSFEVDVKDHTRLRLEAVNGNVIITGLSESDSVMITGEKSVGSESIKDAEDHLQELEVSVQDLGSEVFVKTVQPGQTYGRSYVVDYTITLPKSLQVLVDNVNGTVRIDSINNRVSADNVNGQVTLNEIFGSAFVNLVNGQIEGEVTLPMAGTADMSTVNGNIELDIPGSTSAEFSASVTHGIITISNLVLQNEVRTPTSLSGRLGDGQGTISLSTVNGSISVSGF
jgi:DUF4097 and DUF4098 domain-containing protein YvlB